MMPEDERLHPRTPDRRGDDLHDARPTTAVGASYSGVEKTIRSNRSRDAALRKPTTGIAGCCALAANDHVAAAPPSSDRLSAPGLREQCPI